MKIGERWQSGRTRTLGKCVKRNLSRVRIPPSPPYKNLLRRLLNQFPIFNWWYKLKMPKDVYPK